MITRRTLVLGAKAALLATGGATARAAGLGGPAGFAGLAAAFARIEAESGGRLGVAVLDNASGAVAGHRADERFPVTSTFKMLAAAAVLARVDAGTERLDRRVRYTAADLVTYSPVTERHVQTGMTLAEICDAAVTLSDNSAGNLLLDAIGGPPGLTAYARSLGDAVTRLDRREAALNEALPGDPSDTTSPAAMIGNLRALALGDALSAESRDRLIGWLIGCRTGDARLRAGLPGWRVGDKTGTGERGTTNDVAVAWPPGRAPVLIAAYSTGSAAPLEHRNATLTAVARAVAAALG